MRGPSRVEVGKGGGWGAGLSARPLAHTPVGELRNEACWPRAILFDFDLTLADSRGPAEECILYALSELGFPPPLRERVRRTIGLSLEETLRLLTGQEDPGLQGRFRSLFLERADLVMVRDTRLLPGVPAALDQLRERGILLGIVSTKFRYRIEAILDRYALRDRFAVIVGGEDVTETKPDPRGLLVALGTLGVTEEMCVYVGDHPVDAEAACQAGVPFVGVLSGSTTEEEFAPFPHLCVVSSVADLSGFLSGGGAGGHREGKRVRGDPKCG